MGFFNGVFRIEVFICGGRIFIYVVGGFFVLGGSGIIEVDEGVFVL